jgi:transposase InsO family protein
MSASLSPPPPERHIEASEPGEVVGIDCFYVGRLAGTKGVVWQYTAIDVASGFAWAELHTSPRNPIARHTRSLVHHVASELAAAGWKLKAAISDNGSEFRSKEFSQELERLGVQHRRIRAGRPTSNGHVERLQLTILEECWRPAFARSLAPKGSALRQDLEQYRGPTTSTGHTPDASPAEGCLVRSSTVPARWEPLDERVSLHLGSRTG